MILIDYNDRRPIYEQIIDRFEQLILCKALPPDSAMPSVRSLAMELSINPNTIQRAYQELERRGYIYSVKGKGSFVSEAKEAASKKQDEMKDELKKCLERAAIAGIKEDEMHDIVRKVMQNK